MRAYITYANDRSDLHRAAREEVAAELRRRYRPRPSVAVQLVEKVRGFVSPLLP